MILADYHCHSTCSEDGKSSPIDMARAAVQKGLEIFCLTEHCECNGFAFTGPVYNQDKSDAARRELAKAGLPIELPYGVEIGQAVEFPDKAEKVLADNPDFDFIIGSVHNLIGEIDFFDMKYKNRAECEDWLTRYIEGLWLTVKNSEYDVIGHIGYPLRYMLVNSGIEMDYKNHRAELYDLFCEIAARGKGIEINTQPVRKWAKPELLCPEELKLFREAGGEIVTVGSDAHRAIDVADALDVAEQMLKDAGFKYYTVFKTARKPEFIKL